MGIHVENKLIGHFCAYAEHAYPVYSLKYQQYLRTIYDSIKGFPNITLAGRQGLFRYLNMDAAIENGILGATSLFDEDLRQRLLTLDADKQYVETGLILKANGK